MIMGIEQFCTPSTSDPAAETVCDIQHRTTDNFEVLDSKKIATYQQFIKHHPNLTNSITAITPSEACCEFEPVELIPAFYGLNGSASIIWMLVLLILWAINLRILEGIPQVAHCLSTLQGL